MLFFLLLSFLSGTVELGAVYLGITMQQPVYIIMLFPLFYQIGNVLMDIIPRKKTLHVWFLIIVGVLIVINSLHFSYYLFCIQLLCSSYCLQLYRLKYKKKCPTWLKRCFRIGGFAASPIMTIFHGQIVFSLVFLLCLSVHLVSKEVTNATEITEYNDAQDERKHLSTVMLFHQLHYFVYTYVMPIYMFRLSGSIILSALSFSITWVVYLLPQVLTDKYRLKNFRIIFFCCHLFLLLCLVLIGVGFCTNNPVVALAGWFFTGLGGGSVFCISHLTRYYETIKMDYSENLGHFGGPFIAFILCRIYLDDAPNILPFVSAMCVFLALLFALNAIMREKEL